MTFIKDLKDYNYKMIRNKLFYIPNKDTYPPFKEGLYLEEYFLKKWQENTPQTKRKYIPALWTNFQIEGWFNAKKRLMQLMLNDWVKKNPSTDGYFAIVQYDDACLLKLPPNTVIYGSCSGDIPIPLIYEDIKNKLEIYHKKTFNEKDILCSFVGSITSNNILPNVRKEMINHLSSNKNFKFLTNNGWTPSVDQNKQNNFIQTTLNSKFALAPRGYGRSSFRFFEIYKLGTIPIYLWNDINWLPFQDVIDYDKISIVLNIKDINKLEKILLEFDEEKYNQMWKDYDKVKHLFTLEGFYNKIIEEVS